MTGPELWAIYQGLGRRIAELERSLIALSTLQKLRLEQWKVKQYLTTHKLENLCRKSRRAYVMRRKRI